MNALIKLTNLIVEAIGPSILRELSGAEVRQFGPACSLQSVGLITQENRVFRVSQRTELFHSPQITITNV